MSQRQTWAADVKSAASSAGSDPAHPERWLIVRPCPSWYRRRWVPTPTQEQRQLPGDHLTRHPAATARHARASMLADVARRQTSRPRRTPSSRRRYCLLTTCSSPSLTRCGPSCSAASLGLSPARDCAGILVGTSWISRARRPLTQEPLMNVGSLFLLSIPRQSALCPPRQRHPRSPWRRSSESSLARTLPRSSHLLSPSSRTAFSKSLSPPKTTSPSPPSQLKVLIPMRSKRRPPPVSSTPRRSRGRLHAPLPARRRTRMLRQIEKKVETIRSSSSLGSRTIRRTQGTGQIRQSGKYIVTGISPGVADRRHTGSTLSPPLFCALLEVSGARLSLAV